MVLINGSNKLNLATSLHQINTVAMKIGIQSSPRFASVYGKSLSSK